VRERIGQGEVEEEAKGNIDVDGGGHLTIREVGVSLEEANFKRMTGSSAGRPSLACEQTAIIARYCSKLTSVFTWRR
jgi:hypothetical protein